MKLESNLRPHPGLFRAALLTAGVVLLGHVAGAQSTPPRLLVSTTADVPASGTLPLITDGSLTAVGGAMDVRPHFVDGHWLASTGFVPADVDGFARVPGLVPGRNASIAVTFLSNEHGFLDGDVLVFGETGGLQMLVSEDKLVAALGLTDVEIDVDAIDFDDLGLLLFSLQSDVDGTFLGPVADGDVLRYEADGSITRVISEAEVQACFTTATGSTSAIGDVQAVEFTGGELWVATQGPSTHDGAVLSCALTPYVVGDEAAIGLGGAELDSLSIVGPGDELPNLTVDRIQAAPGETFHAEFRGAPGSAQIVLTAGDAGYIDLTWLPGWGALTMSPADMWLQAMLDAPLLNLVILDASGAHAVDYTLPTLDVWGLGLGAEPGWSFQMVDLRTLEVSAPFRVEKL